MAGSWDNAKTWERYGASIEHGRPRGVTSGLEAVQDDQAVALMVSLAHRIVRAEVPFALDGSIAPVDFGLEQTGTSAIADVPAAQQIAWELSEVFERLVQKRAAIHLFYSGPVAILMMAIGALRVASGLRIYERGTWGGKAPRFRATVRIDEGAATLLAGS